MMISSDYCKKAADDAVLKVLHTDPLDIYEKAIASKWLRAMEAGGYGYFKWSEYRRRFRWVNPNGS